MRLIEVVGGSGWGSGGCATVSMLEGRDSSESSVCNYAILARADVHARTHAQEKNKFLQTGLELAQSGYETRVTRAQRCLLLESVLQYE